MLLLPVADTGRAGMPDGFALGESVSVCGLGGVEGKFLKVIVEKHPWARAQARRQTAANCSMGPPSKQRCATRVPQTAVRQPAVGNLIYLVCLACLHVNTKMSAATACSVRRIAWFPYQRSQRNFLIKTRRLPRTILVVSRGFQPSSEVANRPQLRGKLILHALNTLRPVWRYPA